MTQKIEKLANRSKFEDSKYAYKPAISEMSIHLANQKKSKQNSKNTSKILDDSLDNDQTFTYYDTSKILENDEDKNDRNIIEKKRLQNNLMKITDIEDVPEIEDIPEILDTRSQPSSKPKFDKAKTTKVTKTTKTTKVTKATINDGILVSSRLYKPGKAKRQIAKFNKAGSTAVIIDKFVKSTSKSPSINKSNYKSNTINLDSGNDSIQAYFSSAYNTAQ